MSQRISGAMLSYVHIGVKLCVTLVFTPILVSFLDQEGYGLFALVGAMAAYLYVLDFGLNDSVLRFFVAHEGDRELRDAFLARMLGFYGLLGLLVLAGTAGLMGLVASVFSVSMGSDEVAKLREMIAITGLGAAALVASNPVTALLFAAERFVFLRGMEIAASILSAVVIVALLHHGFREVMVVSVMAGGMITQVALRVLYLRLQMGVPISLARPEATELRRVIGYAAPIFLSMIAGSVFWKLDNILIGAILGAAPVAVYAIGVTFNKYFMTFATAISRIMTPEIVRRIDKGADAAALTDLMVRISRLQALALFLVLGGLVVFGQRFLVLWLGPDYAVSYWVMLAVLCPYALELIGNSRNVVLQVKGLYWHKSAITGVMAVLNIPLTVWLLHVWGVVGAALATGAAVLGGYALIALLLQRCVGISMGRYWRETAYGILPVFALLVVGGRLIEPWLPDGWAGLLVGTVLFTAVYATAMTLLAANGYERQLIRRILVRLRPRRGAAT